MVAVLTSSATEPRPARRGAISAVLAGADRARCGCPAYLASAHLTFDDGVFGASAVAMRAGGQPYRDVFSSQGPLFLPLVWVADLLGLRTANAPRLLSLAAALVLVLATYAAGRAVTDRGGALLAGGAGERHDDLALDHRAARRRRRRAGLRHRDDGDGPAVAATR